MCLVLVVACRFRFDEAKRDGSTDGVGDSAAAIDAATCGDVSPTRDWLAAPMPLDSAKQYAVTADGLGVVDSITGLVWQRDAAPGTADYATAVAYCNGLSLSGCSQWRLPERIELASLVDHRTFIPTLGAPFGNTPTDVQYWAATAATSSANNWMVNFYNGNTFWNADTALGHVRCVTAGAVSTAPPSRYTITATTVRDVDTQLEWLRAPSSSTYSQAGAAAYCTGEATDGGGWRLPEVQELETLVDTTVGPPAINTTAFPGTPSATFWSVSTYPGAGMVIDFTDGFINNSPVANLHTVRCVR